MPAHPGAKTKLDAETLATTLPDDIIEKTIALLDIANRVELSFATAESCTGGLLSSLLTDIQGASKAFERGFIVYSEEAKCELLDLDRELIDRFGAVSEPVARAMAEGALNRSKADIAVAITGFAGPGGPDDEPGLVHFACAGRDVGTQHCVKHFGDVGRGVTRVKSLRVALELLTAMVSAQSSS